ncbi:WD40 repeat-like protein [Cutaneotrichosporon oleaginosum]|uniref:WD40 repeat-like protein n=1 Tax=Cutaneotrichosporon oleaginosum TaxID=879819 RepID=A0A0J0XTM0_9TREE|nr:WD40 repeat-like protein [Cutaneotrichosporon oleaginosum]KLT44428.1 WD40 repeat-like protein [Cutaneotrichosporon oleaginosum]TXT07852.1 hypothetical protein COLE_04776 [Cutaneotrichosporon oleaginosum]
MLELMSSHDTDFTRRLRAVASASPGPSRTKRSHHPSRDFDRDVFGEIEPPAARGTSPKLKEKGKAVERDYGDRFIPTREEADIHTAYSLLTEDGGYHNGLNKPRTRGKNVASLSSDAEARREEVHNTFSHLLKIELLPGSITPSRSTSPTGRPSPSRLGRGRNVVTFTTSNHQNLPVSNAPQSSAGTTPLHHHPPPGVTGDRADREMSPASHLPPLPLHAPSTPTSGHTRPPGAGPSSNQARAHQSQVALTSAAAGAATPPSRKIAYSPPPGRASPSTPSKKRVYTFSSPASKRMAELTNGNNLDDMGHERYSLSPVGRSTQSVLLSPRKSVRQISRTPFKVLDAPELQDDFYLNLVSWSQSNVLGVGLNSCVYLWSAQTSRVTKLCDLVASQGEDGGDHPPDSITGLEWTNKGSTLAIGTARGVVEIWDAEYCKRIRTMTGHNGRVGCLAWNHNILSSGSRDRTILHRDTRMPQHYMRRLSGHHKQEVCGLKWNPDTDQLASGGNDNKLYVWGGTDNRPTWRFGEHRAAVKAIAWSPHQRGVLASGGGTADKKIRFWNSLTGGLVSEWDTGSQVCNLMWSRNSNEIVSTHGYSAGPIQNQIHIWRYPSMTQVATLTGHTFRVLYLAMSPDGQTIVTGAGDETLRFWNAFQRPSGEGRVNLSSGGPSGLNPFAKLR